MVTINWTSEMLGRFAKALAQAKGAHVEEFEFDGHTYVVAYAEHLLDYLSDMLAASLGVQ